MNNQEELSQISLKVTFSIFFSLLLSICSLFDKDLSTIMEISIILIRNIVSKQTKETMDLEYPSHGNVDIQKQLNRADKLTSRLNITLKRISETEPISKRQKEHIVKLISSDQAYPLLRYLNKQVISLDREVGPKESRWNVLHLCAKYNAQNCLRLALRKLYQQDNDEYFRSINQQTSEGYTPLMISIIYQANLGLAVLLQFGGSQLSIMDSSKLRAYDLAINYHNELAIQQLISYDGRCKRHISLNRQQLEKQVQIPQEVSWCGSFMGCLFDYLLCLKRDEDELPQMIDNPLLQKFTSLIKGDEKLYQFDAIKIGSRKDIEDYDVQWKKLSTIQSQKFVLFDSFKPLDISENQLSLRHNLMILQALSDYSWILKRAISKLDDPKSKNKPQVAKFHVCLYKNFTAVKQEVDQCVPFLKEKGEIMFISNPNEIWPSILQKGLAKMYGSYINLNNIVPSQTLEDITGFYSQSIALNRLPLHSLFSILQEYNMKGYMILLQGRQKTQLNNTQNTQLYTILNYYQKGNTRKILVNCPHLVSKWKQPKQNRQLAILKAHFNKHNQSCIWIDDSKLDYYFKNIVICYLKENYLRNQLKIKMKVKNQNEQSNKQIFEDAKKVIKHYKKSIFFRFKIDKKSDQPIILQLVDLQTKHRFDLSSLSGWRNEGTDIVVHQPQSPNCRELIKIIGEPGEYTCMFQISQKQTQVKLSSTQQNRSIIKIRKEGEDDFKSQASDIRENTEESRKKVKLNLGPEHLKQLLLLSWWNQSLQLEYLQQQIGSIEWLSYFKTYSIANWNQLMKDRKQQDCFLFQTVNFKTVLLVKSTKAKKVYLQFLNYANESFNKSNHLIEGNLVELESKLSIQLIKQNKNTTFYYTVVSNLPIQDMERQKRLRFLYQYE